jgi:hypothetical protein
MINADAIKIASEIQIAQKKATLNTNTFGILVNVDPNKGKYEFYPVEKLPIDNQELGQIIKDVSHKIELNKAHLGEVTNSIKELYNKLELLANQFTSFKTTVIGAFGEIETKIEEKDEEGEIL